MKNIILTIAILFTCTILAHTAAAQHATVYVYANSAETSSGRLEKPVFLDEKEIAEIRPEHYFIASVPAGKHTFRLRKKDLGKVEQEFEAGKNYYISVKFKSNGIYISLRGIALVPEETGVVDLKKLKPVDKGNIKDASVARIEP
jgi:hypothetical protein